MEQLNTFVNSIPDFTKLTHADRVRLIAWYLHTHEKREKFKVQEIGACYDLLNLERPKNLSRTVDALTETRPKQLIRSTAGYSLVRAIREEYDGKYGERNTAIEVTKLLVDLPAKVSDLAESTFLSETLICLRHGAFRATIVMCWNLAYSHFCSWLLSNHSGPFNKSVARSLS